MVVVEGLRHCSLIGTTRLDNLDDLAAGVHVRLTEEEVKYIDEPYRPCPIAGHQAKICDSLGYLLHTTCNIIISGLKCPLYKLRKTVPKTLKVYETEGTCGVW